MDIVVVMALAAESRGRLEAAGANVLYTGVGKVNATYRLTRYLLERRAAGGAMPRVLNLGTAGSQQHAAAEFFACDRFVQRDMDARPLGFPQGTTPFDDVPAELIVPAELAWLPTTVCASGDSFVTAPGALTAGVLEMEAFALARVCLAEGVRFACAKYVTDGADAAAAGHWQARVGDATDAFVETWRRWSQLG